MSDTPDLHVVDPPRETLEAFLVRLREKLATEDEGVVEHVRGETRVGRRGALAEDFTPAGELLLEG